ncbi:MAG: MFS transporter [Anaerolineae bacterium]|nr:MAG: MFS transporter [Anaerolineae bacterium]
MQIADRARPGWQRTLYIIFFVQLVTAVGFSSIFPFLPLYVDELGATTSLSVELLAALVFSAQAFTMMLASPIWGSLADRYGRKLMVERATFGGALVILLMAFVTSAEQLVILRSIQGLITGTLAASNALVAAAVPRQRTGYAMGLLQVSLGAGLAIGPLIGGLAADTFGYSSAFFITSGLLVIAGFTVMFGVREEFEPLLSLTRSPLVFLKEWRSIIIGTGVSLSYTMRFISQLGRMMVLPITPLFIGQLLVDQSRLNTFTGLVVAVSSATLTVAAIYLGRIGDRIGHKRILVVSMFMAGLLYLPQSLATEAWQLLILMALVGVAMGGVIPSISSLLARYSHEGSEGVVFGLDNSVRAGARAVSPLVGAAVALAFGLRATFLATGLIFILGALLAGLRLPEPARQSAVGPSPERKSARDPV